MKTLPSLAAGLLALLLVLGPTVAYAATVTVATDASSYSGTQAVHVSGTVSPAPGAGQAVFVSVKNPGGQTVPLGTANVDATSGAFAFTFNTGGPYFSSSGTYTVIVASGSTTGQATFTYNPGAGGGGGGGAPYLIVSAVAGSPVWPGQKESLAVLLQWNNGSLACDTPCFTTVHFYTPGGTLVTVYNPSNSSTNPVTVHRGFFIWTWTVPANSPDGLYAVHAWATVKLGGVTYQGQGLTSFTINSAIASKTQVDALTATLTKIESTTTTIETALGSTLGNIKTSLSDLTTAVGTLTTSVNSLSSTMSTIQSNLSTLMSDLSSLQTTISSLSGLSGQITALQNAISSNQTYVLVVAALAAITLVLELAILVRKLS